MINGRYRSSLYLSHNATTAMDADVLHSAWGPGAAPQPQPSGLPWHVLRKWTKHIGTFESINRAMMKRRTQLQAMQAMSSGAITFELNSQEDVDATPYWLQGDASLACEEALEARSHLRLHSGVVEELQRWWETAQRSLQSGPDPSASEMAKNDYIRISRLLSKAMLPQFDVAEAHAEAEKDWEEDSHGKDTISRVGFMDAIFQIADVWTANVDAGEYVTFLRELFERIAFLQTGSTWFWKDEDAVEPGDYMEEEEEEEEEVVVVAEEEAALPSPKKAKAKPEKPPKAPKTPHSVPHHKAKKQKAKSFKRLMPGEPEPLPPPQQPRKEYEHHQHKQLKDTRAPSPQPSLLHMPSPLVRPSTPPISTFHRPEVEKKGREKHSGEVAPIWSNEQHRSVDLSAVDARARDHHDAPAVPEVAWHAGGEDVIFAGGVAAVDPRNREPIPEVPYDWCHDSVPSYGPFVSKRERKSILEVSLPKPSPCYTPVSHPRMEQPICPPFDPASVTPLPSFASFLGRDLSPSAVSLPRAAAPLDVDIRGPPTPRHARPHSADAEEPALRMAQLRVRRSEALRSQASRSANTPPPLKSVWTLKPPTAPAVAAAAIAKLAPPTMVKAAMARSVSCGACRSGVQHCTSNGSGRRSADHRLRAASAARAAAADGRAVMGLQRKINQLAPSGIELSPPVGARPGTAPMPSLARSRAPRSLAAWGVHASLSAPSLGSYREQRLVLGDDDASWPETQGQVPSAEGMNEQYAVRGVFRPIDRAQAKPSRRLSRFHGGWVRDSNNRGLEGYAVRGSKGLCGSPLVGRALHK